MLLDFLAGPLTFHHRLELLGASSLVALLSRSMEGSSSKCGLFLWNGQEQPAPAYLADPVLFGAPGPGAGTPLDGSDSGQTDRPIQASSQDLPSASAQGLAEMPQRADFVLAAGSLGGAELQRSLEDIKRRMTESSVFAFLGYCGPRGGPKDEECSVVSDIVRAIPAQISQPEMFVDAAAVKRFYAQTLLWPHSGLVEGAIEAHFKNMEVYELGGLLCWPLWFSTAGKLDYNRDEQVAIPLLAQVIEHRLMSYQILRSGLRLIIARR